MAQYKFKLIIDQLTKTSNLFFLEKIRIKEVEDLGSSIVVACAVEAGSLTEAVLYTVKVIEARTRGKVVGLSRSDVVNIAEAARRLRLTRQAIHERRKQVKTPPLALSGEAVFFSYSDWVRESLSTYKIPPTVVDEAKEVEELNLWFRNRMRDEPIPMTIDRLDSLYSLI